MVLATDLSVGPVEHPLYDWFAGWTGLGRSERGGPIARLYDTGTAKELMAFENCSQACFSPDGQFIATAHEDGTIRIWRAPPTRPLELVLGVPVSIWLAEVIGAYLLARRSQRRLAA